MSLEITEVYFIQDEKGKVWKDSARSMHNQCRNDFVNNWFTRVPLDPNTCWNVWGCFEKQGWKIQSLEINKTE